MSDENENSIMFIVAYLVPILTGLIVYVMYGEKDKRLKIHSIQSILLGVVIVVLDIVFTIIDSFAFVYLLYIIFDVITALIWIFGIYVGFKAMNNIEVEIPYISQYAKSLA
jgi:uncharacterized membrane protein